MPRLTVDVEKLMVGLYAPALAGVAVKASPDVDMVDSLPLLIVSPLQGSMVSNGYPGGGWLWVVSLTVLAKGHGAAADLADLVYQVTHGFDDTHAVLPGVGGIGAVEDESMFTRVTTVVQLNNLTQFTGAFQIVILPV